jgi:hypothetical protein
MNEYPVHSRTVKPSCELDRLKKLLDRILDAHDWNNLLASASDRNASITTANGPQRISSASTLLAIAGALSTSDLPQRTQRTQRIRWAVIGANQSAGPSTGR